MNLIYAALGAFTLSLLYSIYRLVKLYKRNAENKSLLMGWNRILFHLLIIPALTYVFNKSITIAIQADTPFAKFGYYSKLTCYFLLWFAIAFLFTYLIPWLISVIRKREISPALLGIIMVFIWGINSSIDTMLLLKVAHKMNHFQTVADNKISETKLEMQNTLDSADPNDPDTKIASYIMKNMDKISPLITKQIENQIKLRPVDYTGSDASLNKLIINGVSSLSEAKSLREKFYLTVKTLEGQNKEWRSTFNKFQIDITQQTKELLSKYDDWNKMSNKFQDEFISEFMMGANEELEQYKSNYINLLAQFEIETPLYFDIAIYNSAIEILDLNIAKLESNNKISGIENDISLKTKAIEGYREQAMEFSNKLLSL